MDSFQYKTEDLDESIQFQDFIESIGFSRDSEMRNMHYSHAVVYNNLWIGGNFRDIAGRGPVYQGSLPLEAYEWSNKKCSS